MAKNLLVINVDIRETRVALIEDGIIAELHIERETSKGTLGNVYLGRVSRVLPGMQAAFIDVGLERAAFLHVEDLIRPDDFEAYLAGHRRTQDEDRASGPTPEQALADEDGAKKESTANDAASEQAARGEPIEVQPEVDDDLQREAEAQLADQGPDERFEAPAPEDHASTEHDAHLGDSSESSEEHERVDAASMGGDDRDAADDEVPAEGEPLVGLGLLAEDEAREDAPAVEEIQADSAERARTDEPQVPATDEPQAQAAGAETEDLTMPRAGGRRRSRGGRVRRSGRTTDRQASTAAATAATTTAEASREGREAVRQGTAGQGNTPAAPGSREGRDARGGREGQGGRDGQKRDGGQGGQNRGRGRNDRGRGGRAQGGRDAQKKAHDPMRVSKQTPIRDVVREGQEVVVQISKEPIGTKGARVSSHVSLAGRYVVYLPTVEHVGISKRIGSDKERARLREAMDAMKPPQGGLIVRTLAEGLTKKHLKSDVGYLVRLWGEIVKKREGAHAPTCLYTELDLVTKTARDLFTDDIEKIVIDNREEYVRLKKFVEMFMPERVDAIELYQDPEPIFDAYGIEDEIQRAQSRKVPLASGGHLIIDQAEALTAIDVNTGRFVGKGSKDLEETILATNLEAVQEIAYQLRFRNIGGLIILDLIDMERSQNREKVRKRLEELLLKDKAKTTLNRISDLGLIEMTRKRTRESLGRILLEPCLYCNGDGQIQSRQTIAYEILRQMKRQKQDLPGYKIVVNAHPAVIDLFKSDERESLIEAERLFQRRIELVPRKEYHLEQFDLQGK